MSIPELKLAAIKEISKPDDEKGLNEIMEHLSPLTGDSKEQDLHLAQHCNTVKEQHDEVLAKLAK
jgi:hypothetical protein